jgi:hypothetical protein
MSIYTQTSDASAVYRDNAGTLIARDNGSAIGPWAVRDSAAVVRVEDCAVAKAYITVYVEDLSPANPV